MILCLDVIIFLKKSKKIWDFPIFPPKNWGFPQKVTPFKSFTPYREGRQTNARQICSKLKIRQTIFILNVWRARQSDQKKNVDFRRSP